MTGSVKTLFFTVSIILIYWLFNSCAQIGSISGGDKDTLAPVMLYSEPAYADTGVTGNRIKITFDEYFTLEDINQEFIASPPFNEFPKFKMKKHTLIIDIPDTLKKPETYTLYFGNAIADLNEKNILENFKFVFSTGSVVDSFAISGRLRNAEDLKVPESSFVVVYRINEDSIPFKVKPDYLSKIDTSGNFSISNIAGGAYKIFAFKDLNGNLMLDPMEDRAFLDTLIVPQREIIVHVDSLKAGTILHDINDTTYADTLQRDTVIITEEHFTYPNNVFLYQFPEINKYQRFAGYNREKRGKLNLTFTIPVNEKYSLKPLNFVLTEGTYIEEINPEKDSLLYWFRDTSVQNIDTLQFEISYESIDSLNNPLVITDTVFAEFREKKADDAWKKEKNRDTVKTEKIEYLNIQPDLEKNKLDLNTSLQFEVSEPLFSIDTAKIKLFEIIDTNTVDTKEQKIIRAIRISENELLIQFRRKIAKRLKLSLAGKPQEEYFTQIRQADSTSYYFKLNDNELAKTDSLDIIIEYDNNFFFDQIQELKDTVKLGLSPQRLKYKNRDKDDMLLLAFLKPLNHKIELHTLNYSGKSGTFRLAQNPLKDSLKILIRDNDLRMQDTIKLSIKSLDYINLKGDSIFYTDTITMVYHEKEQYLAAYERLKPNKVKLIFNKSLSGNLNITALNFKQEKWYSPKFNPAKDTVQLNIFNPDISRKDSLKVVISYQDKNRHQELKEFSDTLWLINKQKKEFKEKETTKKQEIQAKAQIVHVDYPVKYNFWQDSSLLRIYHINTEWKADTKYKLRIDSMAFEGFLAHYNQDFEQEFSTQKEDYYALLNINIKNIHPDFSNIKSDSLNVDTTSTDTLIISKPVVYSEFLKNRTKKVLGEGQIIVQLLKTDKDGNEDLFREYILKEDKKLEISYINPATYRLKVIFDRNANGKWDTGNYLEHIQPEKVIYFPKNFEMKEGWEMNTDWDIGKSLIKSLEEGD